MAYVGVPAFIVTLAGMLIFRGGNQFIGDVEHGPGPRGLPGDRPGYLPEVGPNLILADGTRIVNTPTLLLGVVAVLAIVWLEFRTRAGEVWVTTRRPCGQRSIKLVLLGW